MDFSNRREAPLEYSQIRKLMEMNKRALEDIQNFLGDDILSAGIICESAADYPD